ncbi:MAG: hypothetical protein BWY82_00628 [Verrucomicrobia bacterium ADurb.Bin474]|nr:MAG: hypothetical protein BWY82_00628 [Verrucomicrobia bacterium ADurb.Bin474]
MLAAMSEKPTSHQVRPRPARKYPLAVFSSVVPSWLFQMPSEMTPTTATTNRIRSRVLMMVYRVILRFGCVI